MDHLRSHTVRTTPVVSAHTHQLHQLHPCTICRRPNNICPHARALQRHHDQHHHPTRTDTNATLASALNAFKPSREFHTASQLHDNWTNGLNFLHSLTLAPPPSRSALPTKLPQQTRDLVASLLHDAVCLLVESCPAPTFTCSCFTVQQHLLSVMETPSAL